MMTSRDPYFETRHLGSTAIRVAAIQSVAHYRARKEADSPQMRLGRLTHCALLEPSAFDRRYTSFPTQLCAGGKTGKCSRNAEPGAAHCWQHGGREEAAIYLATLGGVEIVTDEERDQALAAADGVRAQMVRLGFGGFLDAGRAEVPFFAHAELLDGGDYRLSVDGPGLEVRGKVDLLLPGVAVDLKGTSQMVDGNRWGWKVRDMGLHVQAALYLDLIECVEGRVPDLWTWLVHESGPPYAVRLFDADPRDLAQGLRLVAVGLRRWKAFFDTGDEWAGWPVGREVVSIPRKRGEEEE